FRTTIKCAPTTTIAQNTLGRPTRQI
ncbi:7-carboxy-7-deazaguanine synthase (EC 4.3.99.3), partial [uncultured Gammaproteobacteria bacterium]